MYQVLISANGRNDCVPFTDLGGAEAFAEEVALCGDDCAILKMVRTLRGRDPAEESSQNDALNAKNLWLSPGLHFPATM